MGHTPVAVCIVECLDFLDELVSLGLFKHVEDLERQLGARRLVCGALNVAAGTSPNDLAWYKLLRHNLGGEE